MTCDDAGVRVVIAPDRFAGTLSAAEAGAAIASGWAERAPHDVLDLAPLSDGGPGFLDVLAPALGGELVAVTVPDPLGTPVPAAVLVVADPAGGRPTAYVEASQAVGPHLVGDGHRTPGTLSSAGAGDLLDAALATGARRVVVGVGAAVTHDAGAGFLGALGAGPLERLGRGGLALGDLGADDVGGLDDLLERLRGVDLVLATPHDLPLLGLQGSNAMDAEERGATPAEAQALEASYGHLVDLVRRRRPERTDLLTGRPLRHDKALAAGAGGGLGWALRVLGARHVDGAELVGGLLDLRARVAAADLVVTGEGTFDWRSLRARVVSHVATLALEAGVPSIVLAGQVSVGRREAMAAGLSGTYAVAERPRDLAAALADPVGSLAARAARIATTWSPA